MLLTSEISITLNRGNLGFYKNLMGDDYKIGDVVVVPIEKVPKSMNVDVHVSCDICGLENRIKYRNYNDCLKYGFYTCQGCKHIKRRITNKEKYGDENFVNVDKRKKTMYETYGCYFNNNKKSKETIISKYGVDNISKLEAVKSKKKESMLSKWGVDNPTYIQDNKFIYSYSGYISYDITNKMHTLYCNKNHEYKITTNLFYSRYYRKSEICTICNPINDLTSNPEKLIFEFIKSNYNGEIIQNYRDGLEIDIYLPELKIGFEFNGLYWHSEEFKERNYHLNKTNYFSERGIRIIHIWEDDWNIKENIIKSMILNKIGISNRIFARKCEIREEFDKVKVRNFLNDNHLQGYNNNIKISIGLYYNNTLVSLMCFDNLEGRNRIDGFNISRFCSLKGNTVVGGASRILKYFIEKNNPPYIISYADYSISDGNLYKNLGFELVSKSYPDYTYNINCVRKHKSNFKKEKLGIKGEIISEHDFMKINGLYRVYDCGKLKFKLNI